MRHLLLLLCLLALPLSAQPVATPLTAGRTADGITYFLPKTAYQLHLLVEKQVYQPGPFARYAGRYLHVKQVGQESTVDHRLVSFEMQQTAIRDTAKCYSLKLKGGKSETAEVRLSDDGVLLAINDEPLTMKQRVPFQPAPARQPADPYRYLDADVRSAGSNAKMAELIARQMEDLQEHRQQLITGEADEMPQDDRQLQRMISEIDAEYQALQSLFTGTTRSDTTEHVVTFCPDKEVEREVLFRISRQLGLVDNDDLAGVPYYIKVEDVYKTDADKYPPVANKKREGLYVNVPGRIKLTIYREDQLLKTFESSAAQFGFTELRDSRPFKRYVTHLQLHPFTGAVTRMISDVEKK